MVSRVMAILLMATMAGCCPDTLYETLTAKPVVQLPKDESPHGSGGEWWYYTGALTAESGDRFGVEVVIFHAAGRRYGFPFADAWVSHYAVLNQSAETYTYDQSYRWDWLPALAYDREGFDLYTPQVQMTGANGRDHVTAALPDGAYALDIDLIDQRDVILHGEDGYVPYGDDLNAFYYSRPQMQAEGTLVVDGESRAVEGELWFDRQWGRDVADPTLRWDWFSLRLSDGSSVMLFVFHDADPVLYEGTYIPVTGESVRLMSQDFTLTPTRWWTSSETEVTYPVGWTITIVPQSLVLTVEAVVDHQEFDARETSANIYWEGLCAIEGTRHGDPVTGSAYVELTNY